MQEKTGATWDRWDKRYKWDKPARVARQGSPNYPDSGMPPSQSLVYRQTDSTTRMPWRARCPNLD
ncbi:hypothetical protein HHJ76_09175 [Mobiluncus mulieris]|uniref:hypothetical protein n=1 Tax=Mobiluncus mulieris TaxID=2052 RepID=UPI0014703A82|nr:hypothetical protein [Mobiluncus mulieris]MCV0013237.1 hypothetical protein [Mobiluncus mulieris]NMW63486.1 hypothetical protein [Mobiluncus mulieris]